MGTCFILRKHHLGVSQVFPHMADSLSVQHIAVVRAMQMPSTPFSHTRRRAPDRALAMRTAIL
jgi:hypothetical protein